MTADITFTRAYPPAHMPMPADRGALGYLPMAAFQYCESVRVASGMGWYLFPPKTMSLMSDGRETFIADEGQWRTFAAEPFASSFFTDIAGNRAKIIQLSIVFVIVGIAILFKK